jgi:hypothetical protein
MKLELHGVLQEILADRTMKRLATTSTPGAAEGGNKADGTAVTMRQVLDELEAVRAGKRVSPDSVVKVAKMFQDELTIDNMPRGQLASLAKYMGLSPFTPDPILRMQLRVRFRDLKSDDRDLYIEGIDSLTKDELKAACEARGLRAFGLAEPEYRSQLNNWLHFSVKEGVPGTLLVLSSAFQIATLPGKAEQPAQALQESISAIDDHVVAEVVLAQSNNAQTEKAAPAAAAAAPAGEAEAKPVAAAAAAAAAKERKETAEQKTHLLAMKLESIEFQNALIKAEREAAESEAQSEKYAKEATRLAQQLAALDAAKNATDAQRLRSEANKAAVAAEESKALASKKQQLVLRMKSQDASRGAAEVSQKQTSKDEATISTLAQGATMAREAAVLAKLRAVRQRLETAEAMAASRKQQAAASGDKKAAPAAGSGGADRYLKQKLDGLMQDIEKDFETLRNSINLVDLLRAADADKDGNVNQQELHSALKKLTASVGSEEAAAALIKRLDADKDGSISVRELEAFLDRYAEALARAEAKLHEEEHATNVAAKK